MRELTLRAVLLGLTMTIVLGAANAYLGLRAGITVAATYPAAVIGMAILRTWKGSLLEENIARTSGSIGEGVAAGAIFTGLNSHVSSSVNSRPPAGTFSHTGARDGEKNPSRPTATTSIGITPDTSFVASMPPRATDSFQR